MTRRAHGDGSLFWDEQRQRWIAIATVGYDGRGRRGGRPQGDEDRGEGQVASEVRESRSRTAVSRSAGVPQLLANAMRWSALMPTGCGLRHGDWFVGIVRASFRVGRNGRCGPAS
jgi:hypothetical protein